MEEEEEEAFTVSPLALILQPWFLWNIEDSDDISYSSCVK